MSVKNELLKSLIISKKTKQKKKNLIDKINDLYENKNDNNESFEEEESENEEYEKKKKMTV